MTKIIIAIALSVSINASVKYDVNIQLNPNDNIVKKIGNIIQKNKNKSIKISLEEGRYMLSSLSKKRQLLELRNVKNFELDGNNSTLFIAKESKGFIFFRNSSNIKVSNMKIDYISKPKVHGKVISINKKNREITFKVSSNDIISLKNNLKNSADNQAKRRYGLVFDNPGILKKGATPVTFIESIKYLKEKKYILKYKKLHTVEVGDNFVIVFRYQSALFRMIDSRNLHFKNITVYSSPSGVFVGNRTSDTSFDNCNVLLKKGDYLSTNADVFHFQSSRIGPKIQNCTIEGVGDDIVALNTYPMFPLKKTGKKELLVSKKNFTIKQKDSISFFDRKIGKIILIADVLKITKYKKNYILKFNKKIPVNINPKALRLYNRETTHKEFLIKDSIFRNSRRFGCYIKAFDGKIVSNQFINLGGSAIAIKNEPRWPGGLNSQNILIKDNNISNCGYGISKTLAPIEVKFLKINGLSEYNEHKNIRIINNKIGIR